MECEWEGCQCRYFDTGIHAKQGVGTSHSYELIAEINLNPEMISYQAIDLSYDHSNAGPKPPADRSRKIKNHENSGNYAKPQTTGRDKFDIRRLYDHTY